jgi:acetyl-CoA carboxylase carboxyltransferase component
VRKRCAGAELLPCLHRFGDCAASLCDVAEGLRSSVEIVDNLNMAIPYIAAERGFIDAVIEPHQTRLLLHQSLRLLRDKQISGVQRKHGLIPI